jgi:hypothetical protein
MYFKPTQIPAISDFLINNCEDINFLINTIEIYLKSFTLPDHFEEPSDYVCAMDYLSNIEGFLAILKHERDNPTKDSVENAN